MSEHETVTEYSVKIWYRSGAYEGDSHCPEDLARKIYADAVKSAGVEFAELHGPDGMLVESKTPDEEQLDGERTEGQPVSAAPAGPRSAGSADPSGSRAPVA